MKCELCNGEVTREVTRDLCYSKECECKICGATYITTSKGLLLLEEKVLV